MFNHIQRFRVVCSQCFGLNLSDHQLEEMTFLGLLAPIKDRFMFQDFKNLT
jgi:hypothetical protein